ncbi:exosporium protein D, partial [Bacillus cereus]
KIFQVEDFQSLTLTKQEGSTSVVSLFVQKTFCICCNDNNDSCDEYYQECN